MTDNSNTAATESNNGNAADVGLEADDIWGDVDFGIDFDSMSTDEIRQRRIMIENEIKILKASIGVYLTRQRFKRIKLKKIKKRLN